MPIYEYRCLACGNVFELLRPYARANEPAACRACDAASERMISRFACRRPAGGAAPGRSAGGRCGSCSGRSCATCR